jgi:hypothetical protein
MSDFPCCTGCEFLIQNSCGLGFKTEALFFTYCYIKDGMRPLENCRKYPDLLRDERQNPET